MQCEYFALEGLTDLVNTIKQVHANLNKDLPIIGLLRVMFDPRITLQQQVSDQLKAHFGDKVFDTVIPRNVRLAEAPSYGLPGVVFDPAAKGSQAFVAFAKRNGRSHRKRCERRLFHVKPQNVLILPGWQNSGPDHWQSRWEAPTRLPPRGPARLDAARAAATGSRGWKKCVLACRRTRGAGGPQPGLHPHRGLGVALPEHRTA